MMALRQLVGVGLAIAILAPTAAGAVSLPWNDAQAIADGPAVASAQVATIRKHLPPAASTVIVQPMQPRDGTQRAYVVALEKALRASGYAVATDVATSPAAHPVQVGVRGLGEGYVLEVALNGRHQMQFYERDQSGGLRPAGPLTLREAN